MTGASIRAGKFSGAGAQRRTVGRKVFGPRRGRSAAEVGCWRSREGVPQHRSSQMCRKNDALQGCGAQRSSDQGRPQGGRRPADHGRPAISDRRSQHPGCHLPPVGTQRCCAGATDTGHVPRVAAARASNTFRQNLVSVHHEVCDLAVNGGRRVVASTTEQVDCFVRRNSESDWSVCLSFCPIRCHADQARPARGSDRAA